LLGFFFLFLLFTSGQSPLGFLCFVTVSTDFLLFPTFFRSTTGHVLYLGVHSSAHHWRLLFSKAFLGPVFHTNCSCVLKSMRGVFGLLSDWSLNLSQDDFSHGFPPTYASSFCCSCYPLFPPPSLRFFFLESFPYVGFRAGNPFRHPLSRLSFRRQSSIRCPKISSGLFQMLGFKRKRFNWGRASSSFCPQGCPHLYPPFFFFLTPTFPLCSTHNNRCFLTFVSGAGIFWFVVANVNFYHFFSTFLSFLIPFLILSLGFLNKVLSFGAVGQFFSFATRRVLPPFPLGDLNHPRVLISTPSQCLLSSIVSSPSPFPTLFFLVPDAPASGLSLPRGPCPESSVKCPRTFLVLQLSPSFQ